jgi:hypothetical protein
MRSLFKVGTPKGWADLPATFIVAVLGNQIFVIFLVGGENPVFFVLSIS